MNTRNYVACLLVLVMACFSVHAQVYKTADDTVKLNKEFIEVSNDIASLTAKLAIAQNNMPGYQSKANTADSKAQDAAVNSSEHADKATEGGVKEARKAKRESKKAFKQAKN